MYLPSPFPSYFPYKPPSDLRRPGVQASGKDCAAYIFELVRAACASSFPVGQYQHIRYSYGAHIYAFTNIIPYYVYIA